MFVSKFSQENEGMSWLLCWLYITGIIHRIFKRGCLENIYCLPVWHVKGLIKPGNLDLQRDSPSKVHKNSK